MHIHTCMHAWPPTLKVPCTMTPSHALTPPLVLHDVKLLLLIETAARPSTAPPPVCHTTNTTSHRPMDHAMRCIPSPVPAPLAWCPPRPALNYHIGLAPSAMTQAGATPPHWLHVSRLCMPVRCAHAVHQAAAKAEPMQHSMCTVRSVRSGAPLRTVQCKTAGHADADHAPRQVGCTTTARTTTSTYIHALHPTLTAPCTMAPGHALTRPLV